MSYCKNGKHKFQPRYSEKWTTAVEEVIRSGVTNIESGNATPYLKEKTYVHDVCVKCGMIAIMKKEIK